MISSPNTISPLPKFDQVREQPRTDLKPDKLEILRADNALKNFLPQAIKFLEGGNERFSENVAHYLMGEIDYLPDECDYLATKISGEAKNALADLLRTHQYGWLGKSEAPEKTIAKLHSPQCKRSPGLGCLRQFLRIVARRPYRNAAGAAAPRHHRS